MKKSDVFVVIMLMLLTALAGFILGYDYGKQEDIPKSADLYGGAVKCIYYREHVQCIVIGAPVQQKQSDMHSHDGNQASLVLPYLEIKQATEKF